MKKLFLLIFSCFSFFFLSAQDEAIFSHYHITPILINPAAAGISGEQQIQFNARAQWTGFTDSPQTYGAIYNGPIGKTFALGLGLFSENAAQLTRNRIQASFAFRFEFKNDIKFSAGFSTEFQRQSIDGDARNGVFFDQADKVLEDILGGKSVFDATLGLYAQFKGTAYVGMTFHNLVRSRLDNIVSTGNSQSFFEYYSLTAGNKFNITDMNFYIEPSLMVRQIRDAPLQIDINAKAGFLDDQLILGASYYVIGDGGAMGVLLGTKLSDFNLFYSYNVSFQEFQKFNTGSHEVTVLLSFKKRSKDIDRGY